MYHQSSGKHDSLASIIIGKSKSGTMKKKSGTIKTRNS